MSMLAPNHTARGARVAAAACLGLTIALTGCVNHETSTPYQPAAGVQTNAAGMQVRNLMFVSDGGTSAKLQGTLISAQDDTLKSITGTSLNSDNSEKSPLSLAIKDVAMKQGQPVNLAAQKVVASGVTAGGMTKLTLTFAKAEQITMMVPVVDAKSSQISES